MALVLKTAPGVEPVTLADAKASLRVDVSTDDALITRLIRAARRRAEVEIHRALINRVYTLYLDCFPDPTIIELPFPPLVSIATVKYLRQSDAVQATLVAGTDYQTDNKSRTGRLAPAYGKSWPATYPQFNAVEVEFTAGYGAAPTDLPDDIVAAVHLLIAHLYEHRELAEAEQLYEIPLGACDLLFPYAVHTLAP